MRLMGLFADEEMWMPTNAQGKSRSNQLAQERPLLLEGEAKAEASKQTEIALRLLRMQMSQADVASTTGLSKADVKRMALEENL